MSLMKPQITRIGLLILLTLGLTACSNESRTRAPSTQVNVVHTAPSFGALSFLRVERNEATLAYGQSGAFSWDSDTYTFNVDSRRLLVAPERLHSFTSTLVGGNDYAIVLGEVGGELQELIIELPREAVPGTESRVLFVHTAGTLGAVDVYMEAPGAVLAAATPRGTLNFRENLAPFNLPSTNYEISLTEVGNPANVFITTQDVITPPGSGIVISILDGANVGIAPLYVLINGGGTDFLLADKNLQSGIRAINAMTSGGALDVTIDSNFSPPLLPAVPVGIPSAYAFFDAGDRNLTVSPAGNPGVLEVDEEFTAENGALGTWFLAGDPGALTASFSVDDGRILNGEARLTIHNGVTSLTAVDVYFVPAGTDINTVAPPASPPSGASVADLNVALGDFELTVRQASTLNVLAGPLAITVAAAGNYGILLTDSVGGATVDITLLDDFN